MKRDAEVVSKVTAFNLLSVFQRDKRIRPTFVPFVRFYSLSNSFHDFSEFVRYYFEKTQEKL